jgi:hypothetical protein
MDYNLTKLYEKVYDNKRFVAKKTISQIYKEDVNVTFQPEGGPPTVYTLPDLYAKTLMKKIKVETAEGIDKPVDSIFVQGGWGTKQDAPKAVFKNIIINSDYDQSADLINYLAENKSKLLELNDITTGSVVNFVDTIIAKLPQQFRTEGLSDFIKAIHLNVMPGASTNVGLGEGTFSIFGTAMKGKSGDLQWSGKEVEIKTNGSSNAGAVLGGDGFMNKITSRLEFISDYTPLKTSQLQLLLSKLNNAKQAFDAKVKNMGKVFDEFKKVYNDYELFAAEKLNKTVRSATIDDMFTRPVTRDFTFIVRPKPGLPTLYDALVSRIKDDINKANERGANLPSQISSMLAAEGGTDLFVKVFANLRTYENTNIDFESQLRQFFKSHNPVGFDPKTNYQNFSRLVGSIAIISYQEHIGFNYITAGNDRTFNIAVINCESGNISDVYNQLLSIPEVQFDLDIDVYEGGAFKSQTVFAKSPRIILK